MDKADYLEALEADSETFIATASTLDRDNPIAVCPGWTVVDLVAHQTLMWGIATANVLAGGEKTPSASPQPPEDPGKLIEWSASVRTDMLEALAATDPEAAAWSFASNNQTAGFWQRRMCHETMVHRWDMQSVALDIDPLFAERATDGIDEYLHVGLQFSSSKPDRTYPTKSLHLHCNDTAGEWTVVADADNNLSIVREHVKGDAAVKADAEELLLWLWGRSNEVEIFGDEAVAAKWQSLAP